MATKSYRYTGLWPVVLALALVCEQIQAANFHVATAQGLQNALTAAAHNGADNNIYLTNGYYEGNFDFNSSEANNVTVLAEPGETNSDVTIDGGGGGIGLSISSSANANTITVQGITFLRNCGSAGIGALQIAAGADATILVNDCSFLSPTNSSGIGLLLASGLNATVSNCTATGTNAGGIGEGISITGVTGNVTLQNCTVISNNAAAGAEGFDYGAITVEDASAIAITGCVVSGNVTSEGGVTCSGTSTTSITLFDNVIADNSGEGAYCVGQEITLTGNTFIGNSINGTGAGALCSSFDTVTLSNNNFTSNSATGSGGGAYCAGTAVTLTGNTFTGNTVSGNTGGGDGFIDTYGGGAFLDGTSIALTSNIFVGNSTILDSGVNSYGGGAFCCNVADTNSTLTVCGNIFQQNAAGSGGGLCTPRLEGAPNGAGPITDMTICGNTFQQNTAVSGGGLNVSASTINLLDNLAAKNLVTTTSSQGGGIWVDASATLNMINNTVSGNTSSGSGGGVAYVITGTVELLNVYNNIIWGNLATAHGADVLLAGTGEERIFSNNDANEIFGIWDLFTNNLDMDPQFVDPTNGNYHLQSGSLCINAGTNNAPSLPLTDLDGHPRIVGGSVDLGCYEFDSAPIFLSIQPSPTNGFQLQWPSVAGVNYAIQKSTNLSNGFIDLISSLPTTAPVNTYTDVPPPGKSSAFYRIRSW